MGLNPLQSQGLAAATAGASQRLQLQHQQGGNEEQQFDPGSRKLALSDFQRVRTLGTGTFARVCLVRPSHGTEADRSQVFALKILRKTEG